MTNQIYRQFQNNFQPPEVLELNLADNQIQSPFITLVLSEFIQIIIKTGERIGKRLDYHTVLKTLLGFAPIDQSDGILQDPINSLNGQLEPLRFVGYAMASLLLQ